MPDDWGYYPYACEKADLFFRVQRWVYTSTGLKGSDITRLYISFFRGYKYYGDLSKNRYHRVQVTLVDNFTSTPNPTRTRYFWAKYRA